MTTLFVDTTIQVDRLLMEDDPGKRSAIDALLGGYEYKAACTYSRLEFKRVVLQNLGLCLTFLIEEGSFFNAMRRAMAQAHVRPRRASTLINIMAWLGHRVSGTIDVEVGGTIDEKLRLQAESIIRTNILVLWKRFEKSVDSLLDRTECARAKEAPRLREGGRIDLTVHQSLCRNKECNNANFLRSKLPQIRGLCTSLDKLAARANPLSEELKAANAELKLALVDLPRVYEYKNCLAIGDVWIHLESVAGGIREFATTNYKESQYLCPAMELEMKTP